MNKVILTGRLTKDVDLRILKDGSSIGNFTVAINRGKELTDFIPVTVFGKTAEFVSKYFKKGSLINVDGRLSLKYDKEQNKNYCSVIGENIAFV